MIVIPPDYSDMFVRLSVALIAGATIGYERSYHGRPAGFRTHALVCTASSLLMLIVVFESHWLRNGVETIRLDPTRMAQGIMTGIGFLGAGVIIKEGLSVRGLTTAASIWITAAIGVLAGIGFYFPLIVSTVFTLGILSVFRQIERVMPTKGYFYFDVRFESGTGITEAHLRELILTHGFSIANLTYRLIGERRIRRYSMVLCTTDKKSASRLAHTLEDDTKVLEFRLAPTGD